MSARSAQRDRTSFELIPESIASRVGDERDTGLLRVGGRCVRGGVRCCVVYETENLTTATVSNTTTPLQQGDVT
jgi:hypothetical protein